MASSIEAIMDAGLFNAGRADLFHTVSEKSRLANPYVGTRTLRVTAPCGAWADALDGRESDTRPAYWASGYDGVHCPTCAARTGAL